MSEIIESFSNVTSEGVTLHLKKKTSLKNGNLESDEFWVSWDKIAESLFKEIKQDESI